MITKTGLKLVAMTIYEDTELRKNIVKISNGIDTIIIDDIHAENKTQAESKDSVD